MDLKCYENITENKAYPDKTLLGPKVFSNLLNAENCIVISTHGRTQSEITHGMRKIVIVWMKEVTEEQKCQPEVFLLSVDYMNRFLIACLDIKKNQLQLLGTACMLIASKLRESNPLTARELIFYTDNSITLDHLLKFEQLVLSKLKWNIAVVTPLDFVQHIMLKIPIEKTGLSPSEVDERAKILISYCACDDSFWYSAPSVVAVACIASALIGHDGRRRNDSSVNNVLHEICGMTNIDLDLLPEYVKHVENMIERARRSMAGEDDQIEYQENIDSRKNEYSTPVPDKAIEIETATTPTDVHNVEF